MNCFAHCFEIFEPPLQGSQESGSSLRLKIPTCKATFSCGPCKTAYQSRTNLGKSVEISDHSRIVLLRGMLLQRHLPGNSDWESSRLQARRRQDTNTKWRSTAAGRAGITNRCTIEVLSCGRFFQIRSVTRSRL